MSLTHQAKKLPVTDIKVDLTKNVRLATDFAVAGQKVDTYDLASMIEAIIAKRGILTPLVLNKDKFVLQGFRRALGGQAILRDPEKYIPDATVRAEVVSALQAVPVLIYSGLTSNEELDLINDHGDRKGIGRTELLRTVWRLYQAGYSELQIANLLYYALAEYTGNLKKLNTMPAVGTPERAERIRKWFHGTVGNFMIAAFNMGERVQTALLLTSLREDGLLPKDSEIKPEFKVKRDRVTELSKAITQDKEKGTWNAETRSGVTFDAKIAEYIKEDAGVKPTPSDTRWTAKEIDDRIPGYQSTAFRTAMKLVSGSQVDSAAELDKLSARSESVMNIIDKHLDRVSHPQVKDVLSRVLHSDPVDFEAFVLQQCETVPENVPVKVS